jgi:rhamnosyltransferase
MDVSLLHQKLLIVLVLYRKGYSESKAYPVLEKIGQATADKFLLIYDNTPDVQSIDISYAFYWHDAHNGGVSKAYNKGAALAAHLGKEYLMLLDQDTVLDNSYFEHLARALAQPGQALQVHVPVIKDKKGILSPFHWKYKRGIRLRRLQLCFDLPHYRFINTGAVIPVMLFHLAGGYDEKLPVDFSDIEFGERLLRVTDHFYVLPVSLQHDFSGTNRLTYPEAMTRFRVFYQASCYMKYKESSLLYLLHAVARAWRLTVLYQNVTFLKILFR